MNVLKFWKKKPLMVSPEDIRRAYQKRHQDIESLKLYDQGKKVIHAPKLRSTV